MNSPPRVTWFSPWILAAFLLISGCQRAPVSPLPLTAYLGGRYELGTIITPSRTLTPKQTGYHEDMSLSSDQQGAYVLYYRNDTLTYKAAMSDTPLESNQTEHSLLYQVGGSSYLKIYLFFNAVNSVDSIATSRVMDVYSKQADTVRFGYRLTHLAARTR